MIIFFLVFSENYDTNGKLSSASSDACTQLNILHAATPLNKKSPITNRIIVEHSRRSPEKEKINKAAGQIQCQAYITS